MDTFADDTLLPGTQVVEDYSFTYNENLKIHLIDTPGFDDTNRKDSEVLKDVAGWLGVTYAKDIRLSGMIYLHRIIDPKMQGSARRNLHMFQKLCGRDCLSNVILATTMWGLVPPADGERRERELIETEDFWGYMYKHGSLILRHTGDRASAMAILNQVIQRRKKLTLEIQYEMNIEGRDLDHTKAGRQLNEDIMKEREKHKQEMLELEESMREALRERDEAAANHYAELQRELQEKINEGNKAQESLKIDLERLQKEREAEFKKIQDQLVEKAKRLDQMNQEYMELSKSLETARADRVVIKEDLQRRDLEMQSMRAQIEESMAAANRKKTGK